MGMPVCTVIAVVPVTGTPDSPGIPDNGGFWPWFRSLWNDSDQTQPKRSDYGPVYAAKAAICDAKFEADQDYCKYQAKRGFGDASTTRACYTRAADDYAVCLSNARQAQIGRAHV